MKIRIPVRARVDLVTLVTGIGRNSYLGKRSIPLGSNEDVGDRNAAFGDRTSSSRARSTLGVVYG